MTAKEEFIRKWGVDLVICLERFKAFNKAIANYMRTAGNNKKDGLIFNYLDLEGNDRINLVPHPYLQYSDEEKKVFEQCFGKPLEVPKKLLMNVTLNDFQGIVNDRREAIKECLAYTPQSRFRNFQTKKKDETNKRTVGHRNVRTANKRRTNKGKRPTKRTKSGGKILRNTN